MRVALPSSRVVDNHRRSDQCVCMFRTSIRFCPAAGLALKSRLCLVDECRMMDLNCTADVAEKQCSFEIANRRGSAEAQSRGVTTSAKSAKEEPAQLSRTSGFRHLKLGGLQF